MKKPPLKGEVPRRCSFKLMRWVNLLGKFFQFLWWNVRILRDFLEGFVVFEHSDGDLSKTVSQTFCSAFIL